MCSIFSSGANKELNCFMVLLDESTKPFTVPAFLKGDDLLTKILASLGVPDKQYFGLQYQDKSRSWNWLSLKKSLHSQIKNFSYASTSIINERNYTIYLAVKFYPNDPSCLLSEATRYQLFLQLNKDVVRGQITVPTQVLPSLYALYLQSTHGDSDCQIASLLNHYPHLAQLSTSIKEEIMRIYQSLKGLPAPEAEFRFLDKVKWFEGYGQRRYSILDDNGNKASLFFHPTGVTICDHNLNSSSLRMFYWPRIASFSIRKHHIFIKFKTKDEEQTFSFGAEKKHQLRGLWKTCCEHLAFFKSYCDPTFARPNRSVLGSKDRGKWNDTLSSREFKFAKDGEMFQNSQKYSAPASPTQSCYATEPPINMHYHNTSNIRHGNRQYDSNSHFSRYDVVHPRENYGGALSDPEAMPTHNYDFSNRKRLRLRTSRRSLSRDHSHSSHSSERLKPSKEFVQCLRQQQTTDVFQQNPREIPFTQLSGPAAVPYIVQYDPLTGRARARRRPPTEILPQSSGPAHEESSEYNSRLRQQTDMFNLSQVLPTSRSAGHNYSYETAVSDTEVHRRRPMMPQAQQLQRIASSSRTTVV